MKPLKKKKNPKGKDYSNSKLSTINILIQIILCCEVWSWAMQDVYQHPKPLPSTFSKNLQPSCDNKKCLQTLPVSPGGTESSPALNK